MDDHAKKLFVQLDDDFPGVRVQALDALRDYLKKAGQSLRDVLHDIENAIPAQRYADLEAKYNGVVDDYNKAVQQNAQWTLSDQKKEQAIAALRREVMVYKGLVWLRLNRTRIALGAVGLAALLAAALHDYNPPPPAAEAGLRAVANAAVWDQGFNTPFVTQIGGDPYWIMLRGDTETDTFSDRQGRTISMRCLHVFAAPAQADFGQFRKPQPYALFGFGWLRWPERVKQCRPAPNQEASK